MIVKQSKVCKRKINQYDRTIPKESKGNAFVGKYFNHVVVVVNRLCLQFAINVRHLRCRYLSNNIDIFIYKIQKS
ncbi:hypothetical protein BMS3Abin03_01887 [bacterium BMS3Abin03]|nr:hypothetical protein BMS3Abin03_01887 [bacterium BMS3Abin03]